jgi:hypothetical protein
MSDAGNVAKSLRERLGVQTEERLGRALSELLENPLLTGAIGRAFDARGKAAQAQEVAMGALNLPSAADIERLTRRLRAVSHRLEGIEDGVDRLDRALAPSGIEARLSAIEAQLQTLTDKLDSTLRNSQRGSGREAAGAGAGKAPRQTAAARTARATRAAKAAKAAQAATTAPRGGAKSSAPRSRGRARKG